MIWSLWWCVFIAPHLLFMQKETKDFLLCILTLVFFFQTEHKMSIEEVCRKYNTDIVQVSLSDRECNARSDLLIRL